MGLVNEFGVGSLLKGFLASKFSLGWRIAKTEMHNCSMITEGYTVILFLIYIYISFIGRDIMIITKKHSPATTRDFPINPT
jgi:hypothetical protein